MKKSIVIICLTVSLTLLLSAGVVKGIQVLGVDVVKTSTLQAGSIQVGEQDVGGVTFFNGTIVNETTNNGIDNPVTFGDDVRIDGRIWRGAIAGTKDSMPLIINDNVEITGSLSVAEGLPQGPKGDVGPQGPQGIQGPPGDSGDIDEPPGCIYGEYLKKTFTGWKCVDAEEILNDAVSILCYSNEYLRKTSLGWECVDIDEILDDAAGFPCFTGDVLVKGVFGWSCGPN